MWEIRRNWIIVSLSILLHVSLVTSQPNCTVSGDTFANDSTYETNLNTLVASLSSTIGNSGFLNASVGQSPDTVNAIVLCRGDISLPACRECVAATAPATAQRCPNRKDAIFWNETCMVRYSSRPIFGVLQIQPVSQVKSTIRAPNPQRHDEELRALLESLRGFAANGGPLKKVAAGNTTAPDVQPIYALEQCTPDLSVRDCTDCLTRAIDDIPTCCSGIIGSGILRPSCTLRFEDYQFYNDSMLQLPQQPITREKPSNKTSIIVAVSLSVSAFVILVFIAVLLRRRNVKQKREENVENSDEVSTDDCHQYDLAKIRAATDDFSADKKLGEGGFGAVYKGIFSNGQEIAVKRLSMGSAQGDMEFKNEVLLMARLQHRNFVRLLGFCLQGKERLLVYEFLENSSLDKFLFDPIKRWQLDWERRLKIIRGIARGIVYLHEDSRFKIIHRDLKASNILLDRDMNPKIADFGMARLFGQEETQGNTSRIVGTFGYMSPEYMMHGEISVKTDIFSFGVLVLEIMSGRKHSSTTQNGETVDLLTYTWEKWQQGTPADNIDPIVRDGSVSLEGMLRCIRIGLLCVQEDPVMRPTMASVVLMLSSSTVALPLPSRPAFLAPNHQTDSDWSIATSQDRPDTSSRNHLSLTNLCPR
ncbi:cysteine-rich receptor-like protein kinase 44 [Salvia miltiorrhiza]|uniref:cysteine-rich receptor-like protein kinase 44 n=1 Tax=Salvia miltiorrhiza TaxID=226208 RepID=UPI0025AC7D45|nr:cysteine-rich receptor-like protein kinase 44 [Salvia miltiorrhiza]